MADDAPAKKFRALLAAPGIITRLVVTSPLTALIAEASGFKVLGIGGNSLGASLGIPEPLLCLEDVAAITRQISRVSNLPIIADIGTGFGEPIHIRHSIRTMQHAGAAGVHIEDQIYPKRAHYHQGIEHVVPLPEMLMRVEAAIEARGDSDFIIVARTDSMRTDGYEEGLRRARALREAGADMVTVFPNNEEETRSAPSDLSGIPLYTANSAGSHKGGGVYKVSDLEQWGWKAVAQSALVGMVAAAAVRDALEELAEHGEVHEDRERMRATRLYVENLIGLEEMYEIERRTVEHS